MTPERLGAIVNARVAVIGDVMIDEYLTGRVDRISPEAPVPVVRGLELRAAPGGAANVAANVAALGAEALLVGVVGAGGAAEVEALISAKGRARALLTEDASRRTIRKMRVISNHQQIVRLDHEDLHPLSDEIEAALIAASRRAIEASDIVVLSDYGKGLFGDRALAAIIGLAKAAAKPVVVDPKRPEFSAYRGADLVTPNRGELARASGLPVGTDAEAEAAARVAQAQFGGALLLTRSEQGMSYFPLHGPAIHAPTAAREVFDVSGAGDTAVATLAAALAARFTMAEALPLANQAAGIVVGKAGTATLSLRELIAALDAPRVSGELVDWEAARRLRDAWARQGLSVGFANGCFDLLHPGHVALIGEAAAACDRLIVALNSDASTRRLKGPDRPAQPQAARAIVMGALKGVAAVVIFEDDTPQALIEALQPDLLVKGADYRIEDVVGADIVQARGGRVLLVETVAGQSTTRLLTQR
ncbi:MAG TPA: D-glycero-beta-D-manno-heptose-7-phosphate kinase [Roseiarcus sp.]|nr:D-glycero-beta-D-manno-heptose-7-phosphate kinase [Roseiarcus sp.]